MALDSEYRAYQQIADMLARLGWNKGNPARRSGGDIYWQGEFRSHDHLLEAALGNRKPEYTILIPWDGGYHYWLIEAKARHADIAQALKEAKDYADTINRHGQQAVARFATGVAGTEKHSFFITTAYWNGRDWKEVSINSYETTGFLSPEQCRDILNKNDHSLALFDDNPDRFLKKANAINRTLQDNEIPVGERASIMVALLLALVQDNNLRIHARPRPLIREINGLIEDILRQYGKEEFADVIRLKLPATEKNHRKFRKAIVNTLQILREMNIRSAINGGDDALGKFYETFLKYANGAKEMGIVLTPRHVTRFAVDVVGIGPRDRVFDPACGTGGFLVSAMEAIRENRPDHYTNFRCEGLFGVEQRDDVYGLAIVNMIFRGDGKSRVYDGNCFDHEFWLRDGEVWYTLPDSPKPEGAKRPFSRVLMNPPFKLASNREPDFVDYGLRQLRRGGILFAVLPAVVVSGAHNRYWRHELLKRHTVRACVRFDKNLFYPVAELTYGLVLHAHRPHKLSDQVFMGLLFDDNHRPRKSKMLADHDVCDNVDIMTDEMRRFMLGRPVRGSVEREQAVISFDPKSFPNFAPEGYIQSGSLPMIDASSRAMASMTIARQTKLSRTTSLGPVQPTEFFSIRQFIDTVLDAPLGTLKSYRPGNVPVVSSAATENGVAAWLDIPDGLCFENCITISLLHNTKPCQAFWHPYRFSALSGKVIVFQPVSELLESQYAVYYLCEAITSGNAWRYSYARQPKLDEIEVELPISKPGVVDFATMGRIVKAQLQ